MSLFILNKSFTAISKKRCRKKSRKSSGHDLKVMCLVSNSSFASKKSFHSNQSLIFYSSLIVKHSYHLKNKQTKRKITCQQKGTPGRLVLSLKSNFVRLIIVVQKVSKTKKHHARAKLLFCYLNHVDFLLFSLPSPSYLTSQLFDGHPTTYDFRVLKSFRIFRIKFHSVLRDIRKVVSTPCTSYPNTSFSHSARQGLQVMMKIPYYLADLA